MNGDLIFVEVVVGRSQKAQEEKRSGGDIGHGRDEDD